MSVEEIIGFVTGALCVWLAVRQNVWNFPIGIANNLVYVVLFVTTGLYAGAGLQVVYLGLAALGWYWWLRGGADGGALVPRETPRWVWPAGAALAAVLAAVLFWVLSTWTDSSAPVMDSLTTSLSLVAQLMLNRKWIGTWWVWIAADVLFVGLYISLELYLTAALYVGFIGLCALGLRDWRREMRADGHGTTPEPVLGVGAGAQPAASQAGADSR